MKMKRKHCSSPTNHSADDLVTLVLNIRLCLENCSCIRTGIDGGFDVFAFNLIPLLLALPYPVHAASQCFAAEMLHIMTSTECTLPRHALKLFCDAIIFLPVTQETCSDSNMAVSRVRDQLEYVLRGLGTCGALSFVGS